MSRSLTPRRARPALALAALLAALGSTTPASPAAAHDALQGSDPAAGSTVATLPETLTLTFSGALQSLTADDTYVDVVSPSGVDLAAADEQIDGAVIRQPLEPAAEAGEYTVTWRAVSSDGHPISDTFTITVEQAAAAEATTAPSASPSAAAEPPASAAPETSAPAEDARGFGELAPWIFAAATAAAIGGALIVLAKARGRRDPGGPAGSGGGSGTPSGR